MSNGKFTTKSVEQTNNFNIVCSRQSEDNYMYVQCGHSYIHGKRDTMEDESRVYIGFPLEHSSFKTTDGTKVTGSLVCVLDGHGGAITSAICADRLPKDISMNFEKGKEIESLHKIFVKIDNDIKALNKNDGSCAVVYIIVDGRYYCACLGDSEATLVKKDADGSVSCEALTNIHKASTPSEKKRIEDVGGKVFFGRVNGMLAVARSFGDTIYKVPKKENNWVLAEPNIITGMINQSMMSVIIACDGLWDVCNHAGASKLVNGWISAGKSAQYCAEHLIRHAMAKESGDNISVCVLNFASITNLMSKHVKLVNDGDNHDTLQITGKSLGKKR